MDNVDWTRLGDGSLRSEWKLPNGIAFGASVRHSSISEREVDMELWLRNGTDKPLTGLRTQVCVMLKAARGFSSQTNDNKLFRDGAAAARSARGDRWILTVWERPGRIWGNPPCPCIHSDPVLSDCAPGQTVRARGILSFFAGKEPEGEIARISSRLANVRSGVDNS